MNLTGTFARTIIRKAIEEQLPSWIGELFGLMIHWISIATPADIDRVAHEMTAERAEKFRRMVAAIQPSGEMTR